MDTFPTSSFMYVVFCISSLFCFLYARDEFLNVLATPLGEQNIVFILFAITWVTYFIRGG